MGIITLRYHTCLGWRATPPISTVYPYCKLYFNCSVNNYFFRESVIGVNEFEIVLVIYEQARTSAKYSILKYARTNLTLLHLEYWCQPLLPSPVK